MKRAFWIPCIAGVMATGLLAAPPQVRGGGAHAGVAHPGIARPFGGLPPAYGSSGPAPVGGVGPAPLGGVGHLGPRPEYGSRVAGRNGFNNARGRESRNNRYWGVLPFDYYIAPYYYPDWSNDDAGFGPQPPVDANAQGAAMAENMLGEQIQRLSAEVAELRAQQMQQQNAEAGNPPPYAVAPEPQTPPPPPITVVLKNGKQLKVENYAVMNGTLWDFSKQPAQRIPASSIDISASQKASEADGAEFPRL